MFHVPFSAINGHPTRLHDYSAIIRRQEEAIKKGWLIIRLYISPYADDFNGRLKHDHMIKGFYLSLDNRRREQSRKLENTQCLGLAPNGARFSECAEVIVKGIQWLEEGGPVVIDKQPCLMMGGMFAFDADMVQAQEGAGCLGVCAKSCCRMCDCVKSELSTDIECIDARAKTLAAVRAVRVEQVARLPNTITATNNKLQLMGLHAIPSVFDALRFNPYTQIRPELCHSELLGICALAISKCGTVNTKGPRETERGSASNRISTILA